jgi:hypothetical protein
MEGGEGLDQGWLTQDMQGSAPLLVLESENLVNGMDSLK